MKKTNEKNRLNSLELLFLTCILLLLNVSIINAQNSHLTFDGNFSLPATTDLGTTDYASGAVDIIEANDKIFVYTMDKILVLSDDGQSIIATIPFDNRYGKYYPVFENSRKYIADINFMTIYPNTNGREDLFVVTPNLDILLINTSTNIITNTYNVSNDIDSLKPLHGVCILKYDEVHQKLYWLIKGRQIISDSGYNTNCTGQFHHREVYFAIYNVQSGGLINTTPIYNFHEYTESGDNISAYRNKNICDFEFNTNDYIGQDYFYLAKYNKIEVWKIPDIITSVDTVKEVYTVNVGNDIYIDEEGDPHYYKFSKLVYLNEDGIHKLIALPYRYPSSVLNTGKSPLIYIFDCDTYGVETITSPNKRVTDAIYLDNTNDLVISYSANPNEQLSTVDIGVYNFDPASPGWLNNIASFNTNNGSNTTVGIDVNTPTNLLKVNNAALISKKDEIIKLYHDGTSYQISAPLVTGENNFYRKGIINPQENKCFIMNTAGGNIEAFNYDADSVITHQNSFNTSFLVNHITANTSGTKQYFFNKMNIENTGFFIYDSENETCININEDNELTNDFTSPVGDVVYNSFKNEFLVSQNSETSGISIYNEDDNSLAGIISLPDSPTSKYAKKMFIDPNGVLYIIVNSFVGEITNPNKPWLLMYDASTYQQISAVELTGNELGLPVINNESEFYISHFCYSTAFDKVFFSITPQELSLPPYQSEYNTMINPNNDPTNNGNLYCVNSNHNVTREKQNIVNPGKIICPDDGNTNNISDFEGKVFIISSGLSIFNINSKTSESLQRVFNDVLYNANTDRLFGFADEENSCGDDRKAVVYEIFPTGSIPAYTFQELAGFSFEGQVTSFFQNPNDSKLFLHTKFDKEKLGGTVSQLVPFNLTTNQVETEITLQDATSNQNLCAYPEFDHCPDFHYYNYILTTPYINPYNNKIYLPNGAHSNVSVVDFSDNLDLVEGGYENWISIPRHTRFDDSEGNFTLIENVFHKDNFENPYYFLNMNYWQPASNTPSYNAKWENGDWGFIPDISDNKQTYSTRGYKVIVNSGHNANSISLSGILENPHTEIELYDHEENWTGYFLHETQDVFDAIADFEEDFYVVQGEDFYCIRSQWIEGGYPQPTPVPTHWECSKETHNISYGEMVILKPYIDIPDFRWNYSGNLPTPIKDEEPKQFLYDKTGGYTPLIIELDSTDNPVELGAFVNDTCVGACTVDYKDSLVIIQGYFGEQPGDSVVFEEYFGTKSSASKKITDYYVYNENKKIHENRVVKTGERKNKYFISFKDKNTVSSSDLSGMVSVFPNPVNEDLTINYTLTTDSEIVIDVFDAMSRKCNTLLNTNQPIGTFEVKWNLQGINNQKVNKGIYIIRITINNSTINKKVVVN